MTSLDCILMKLKGTAFKVFDEEGNLTEEGYSEYEKLIEIIEDVESITFNFDSPRIIDELDKIADKSYIY